MKSFKDLIQLAWLITFSLIYISPLHAEPYPGLPTRSQNPLLQGYLIPATPNTAEEGWSFSHVLYITNTYQLDQASSEQAIIDVENRRYDFQFTYSQSLWHFNLNTSLIENSSGFMDQNIESWHDFFSLPQGGRDTAKNDQINLYYEKDGQTVINSQQPGNGLGDIQLALGYQLNEYNQLWLSVEIPVNSSYDFITNDGVDLSFWLSTLNDQSEIINLYASFGLVIPANDGLFKNRLKDQFFFGQLGFNYVFNPAYELVLQADYHSPIVKDSKLDALDHSLQAQFGLRFTNLIDDHILDIFFSEDVFPGHAPDITFAIRLSTYKF